ncbi:TolC family protein [Sphingobacterium phlebotomi]|uniref:TolC family protein n=1 Tax=Sphingobacterium phlebotomi TaxID=2605433 RepID=A0A5D4H476_9SPHI|nr:TolC family protein [Sphingobacterium phlebotomi]TYR35407.1 TolC family protein [Sphingobacterium phlebotomi]
MEKKWGWIFILFSFIFQQTGRAQSIIDPKVKEIIQQSFQTNKDLRLKNYEVDKANLEVEGVKANKLPHVSATGLYGFMYNNGSLDIPTLNLPVLNLGLFEGATDFNLRSQAAYAGVSVRQVIFSGLQIPNGERALQEKARAQGYLAEAGKEGMAKEIAVTFDQLMLLNQVDKLIVDSERRLKKEQEKVNKAIENGLAIPYDRDKLKLALLELEEKKVELAGNRALLVKKIQQETDLSTSAVEEVLYNLSPIYLSDVPTGVEERSELKALDASSKAYEYLYKKEKGASLPTAFAFGSASYLNLHNTNLTIKDRPVVGDIELSTNHLKGRPNFMIGVGLRWDIFNGGEHRNKVKQVQLDQIINETKLLDATEKLNLLLDKNKVSYTNTNQKLKVGDQQIKVAENNLQMASKQYEAGLIDVTELLATENEWYKVNLNFYSHVLQQRAVALELLHTSGKLLQTIYE